MDLLKKPYKFEEPIKKRAKAKKKDGSYDKSQQFDEPIIKKKCNRMQHTNITTRTNSTMKFNILQNHKANYMNSTPFYTASGG